MSIELSSIPPPLMPMTPSVNQPSLVAFNETGANRSVQGIGGSPSPQQGATPGNTASSQTDANNTTSVEQGRAAEANTSSPQDDRASRTSGERAQELQDQRMIRELGARDREVRQHEMAHQAAGGGHTGAVSYSYQRGPDGRMYAVGGEVSIDTSGVSGDPRATLEKAEAIIRAAMAPAEPSSQDYRVAASARAMAAEARAELARMEDDQRAADDPVSEDDNAAISGSEAGRVEQDVQSGTALASQSEATATNPVATDIGGQQMNAVQQQLVAAGVYSPLYPSGSLLNLQA